MANPQHRPSALTGEVIGPDEKLDRPWQHGDPFELPEGRPHRTRPATAFEALGGDPVQMIAALFVGPRDKYEPRGDDDERTPEEIERANLEARLYDLLDYQQMSPTAEIRERLSQCAARIADLEHLGEHVPGNLRKLHEFWIRNLERAERRDQIHAACVVIDPACWCMGAGGAGRVGVVAHDGEGGLFSSKDCLVSFRTYCPCPEGQRCEAEARQYRADLKRNGRQRRMQAKTAALFSKARIPRKFQHLTLATHPDAVAAAKCERWYLMHLGEIPRSTTRKLKPFLLLHGPHRRGKTGLGIGLLKLALDRDIQAVFRTLSDLLSELKGTFDKDNPACHNDVLDFLKNVPLLILDDLGAERLTTGQSWVAETVYSLLNHRHLEELPTVLTTNLGWAGNAAVTQRSRLLANPDAVMWTPEDHDGEQLLSYLGERIWWRVDDSSDRLRMIGRVLGYDDEPAPAPDADVDDPEL